MSTNEAPLARWACDPGTSRGRRHNEPSGETRGPRSVFQRDRDRIIHSIAFRRLRQKTQVFVAPDGDHFRVRLTHSLEVAQIARTIARALGLNEDLTEALALAHDIGHPPFGHAGEAALQSAMIAAGGFDHNGHTLRVLTMLESPYPLWRGLNLTWETLEGLAKHNGPVTTAGWALAAVDDEHALDLTSHASLEAQVAAIADDIAYDNHDIDDGLRAGLIDFDQLIGLPRLGALWRGVQARFPGVDTKRLRAELIRQQIGLMVNDVIETTRATIADCGIESIHDVRAAGRSIVQFSHGLAAHEKGLKQFMYANLYHHPHQLGVATRARDLLGRLFCAYADDVALLPEDWRKTLPTDATQLTRHIGDFLAGMTDRYAIARYRDAVGPIDMPDGF